MASKRYSEVKSNYDNKVWGIGALRRAVMLKWITAKEYKFICGEDYE